MLTKLWLSTLAIRLRQYEERLYWSIPTVKTSITIQTRWRILFWFSLHAMIISILWFSLGFMKLACFVIDAMFEEKPDDAKVIKSSKTFKRKKEYQSWTLCSHKLFKHLTFQPLLFPSHSPAMLLSYWVNKDLRKAMQWMEYPCLSIKYLNLNMIIYQQLLLHLWIQVDKFIELLGLSKVEHPRQI